MRMILLPMGDPLPDVLNLDTRILLYESYGEDWLMLGSGRLVFSTHNGLGQEYEVEVRADELPSSAQEELAYVLTHYQQRA